ncbi:MAG TPA: DUF222 domain-containing protein [Trebonia sp.]
MSEVSFPGDGQGGEQPLPGVPARDGCPEMPDGYSAGDWDEVPGVRPSADFDLDAEAARFEADLAAGRVWVPAPEPWELEGPSATLALPDAARHVDLAELAAVVGPEGLCTEVFDQERVAEAMAPGPVLAALIGQGGQQVGRLSPGQLVGMATAAGRVAAWAQFLQLAAIGAFAGYWEARAAARKMPPGRGPGEFAAEELAMELVTSPRAALDTIDLAQDLQARLPATRAGLAAGVIDADRARIIGRYTRFLSDPDAATADEILARVAAELTCEQLARKALATAMKLDPEAMQRGKDEARKQRQRIEARREESGNASLAGRELAVQDVLASKAHMDALAAALRRGGVPGSLRELRVLVYVDLTQGRDPLARLTRPAAPGEAGPDGGHQLGPRHRDAGEGDDDSRGDSGADDGGAEDDAGSRGSPGTAGNGCSDTGDFAGDTGEDDGDDGETGGPDAPGRSGRMPEPSSPSGSPAPFPALINLTIPAGTLFGFSCAPGDAAGWGLLDSADTRRLTQAAAAHPATRWAVTLLAPDGTAAAHGRARGPRTWTPPPGGGNSRDGPAALAAFLRDLNPALTPIATGSCDHAAAEHRYVPSRALKDLVRARTATCPAPGCGARAYHNDLDHTIAYPAGLTCQCDLSPPCRHHHRVKQAPGWRLEQPEPGIMRWHTPSGRSYTTRPTVYET